MNRVRDFVLHAYVGFVRTAVTAPAFSYLRPIRGANEGVVDQAGIEPATS